MAENVRMPDGPLAPSPYQVLGVAEDASEAALRRAYRSKLRQTHPDTGGDAAEFRRVQQAWEQVGTPEARAAYDAGRSRASGVEERTWAPAPPSRRASASRPQARVHGHPGGWNREQYLDQLKEWVGRGSDIPNPYDLALVRSAPWEIQHALASAIAEEDTATKLAELGIAFTVWHDVQSGPGRGGWAKIDHIVLGPTGLWAILSEDWGGEVKTRRGEIIGPGVGRDERPMHDLARRARAFEKPAHVRFTALAIVVADDASPEGVIELGSFRGATTYLVQRSRLAHLVGQRPSGLAFGGTDLFEVRTRVQSAARFV